MKSCNVKTVEEFSQLIYDLIRVDNGINIGVAGETGSGKSCFLSQVMKAYGKIAGNPWDYKHITWSRKELMLWIDGDKKTQPVNGLRKGQLPEYSCIMPDELYAMFCAKNWFSEDQIDSVTTFNTCRDRHLLIGGATPNFWDLESSFTDRITYYTYIPWRGTAWVFEKENNPFTRNKWNPEENKKLFRKHHNPYSCPNFLCEIHFEDWDAEERKRYYEIRNEKRIGMGEDILRKERYTDIKKQRDILIKMCFQLDKKLKLKTIAEMIDLTPEAISMIRNGVG